MENNWYLQCKEVVRNYVREKLDEFALFEESEDYTIEDIRSLINYCKISPKFQSVANTGNLEVLFHELYSTEGSDVRADLLRDLYIELICTVGEHGYQECIKSVSKVISSIGDCALVAKHSKHPKVPAQGLEKIYHENYWLFICILIRLTSFIDKEFEDEAKGAG